MSVQKETKQTGRRYIKLSFSMCKLDICSFRFHQIFIFLLQLLLVPLIADSPPLVVKCGTVARGDSSRWPEISAHSVNYLDCFTTEWHLKPLLCYLLSGDIHKSPVMFVAT